MHPAPMTNEAKLRAAASVSRTCAPLPFNFDEANAFAPNTGITYPRLIPQRLVMGLAAGEGPLVKSFVSEQEVFLQRSNLRTKGTKVFVTPPLSWDEQNFKQ